MSETLTNDNIVSSRPVLFSEDLKVDSHIILSNKNFKETLLSFNYSEHSDTEKIDLDPFPNPYILAHFAYEAYKNVTECHSDDSYEFEGWRLLTIAYNKAKGNGYYGAAYWNPNTLQVIITHRGTVLTNLGSLWTDWKGILHKEYVSQMNSAITFADKIRSALLELHDPPKIAFQLSFTGHSLGGWLAQVTCFTVKYLKRADQNFIKNENDFVRCHAHTVVFESPGCKNMLTKMKMDFDVRYRSELSLNKLDIISYLSAPNRFNSCNLHLGTIYRIFIDFSDFTILEKQTPLYHMAVHKMKKIGEVFETNGDILKDENGIRKIQEVIDWPVTTSLMTVKELDVFFKWANNLNKYHPCPIDVAFRKSSEIIRYQTVEYKEDSCSINLFTHEELTLLECIQKLINTRMQLRFLDEFVNKHQLQGCKTLLANFEMDKQNKKIKCESRDTLLKLVKCWKQLFRWFPEELTKVVRDQIHDVPSVAKSMCLLESNNYLKSLFQTDFKFKDIIGLKDFLQSDKRLLYLETNDCRWEATRLYNLMELIDSHIENNVIFLNWDQFLTLNRIIDFDYILDNETNTFNLIVLECLSTNVNEDAESLLNKLLQSPSRIIIISSNKNVWIEKSPLFESHLPGRFKKIEKLNLSFSDLTEDSRHKLMNMKSVSLLKEVLTLNELLGINCNINKLDTFITEDILKYLITKGNEVVEIASELKRTNDFDTLYSEVYKEVPLKCIVNILSDGNSISQHIRKEVIFMISGVCEENKLIEYLYITEKEIVANLKTLIQSKNIVISNYEDHKYGFKKLCSDNSNCRIYWLEVTEGQVNWQEVYDSDFYIMRRFKCPLILRDKKKEMLKSVTDFMIFSNVRNYGNLASIFETAENEIEKLLTDKQVNNVRILKDDEDENTVFTKVSEFGKSVHLFRLEERNGTEKLIWQRSTGSLEKLRNFVFSDQSIHEEKFCEKRERVILIAGEPGMGKSTCLSSFARYIKSSWIIRIDLKGYSQRIKDLAPNLNFENVTEFLLASDGKDGITNSIRKKFLEHSLENGSNIPVIIMFDGFDEIEEGYINEPKQIKQMSQNKIIKLLKFLKEKTTACFWVTTRMYMKYSLENNLSVFAANLEEVGKEKFEFLIRLWLSRISLEIGSGYDQASIKIEEYARCILQRAESVFGEEISSFIGVPLQMKMLAEVLQPSASLLTQQNCDITEYIDEFDMLSLFERFISAKYDLYLKEKSGLATCLTETSRKWLIETLTKKHQCLGFQFLFPDIAKAFLGENFIHLGQDSINDDEIELNRVGLIQSHENGEFEWLHYTLAEFYCADLVAKWLGKSHGRNPKYPPLIHFLLSRVLLEPKYKLVRLFLNQNLTKTELHPNVINTFRYHISNHWKQNKNEYRNDKLQTALHILVEEGLGTLINFFLGKEDSNAHSICLIAARDKKDDTALFTAARNKDENIVGKFLEFMKSCSEQSKHKLLLATFFRLFKEEQNTIVEYLFLKMENIFEFKDVLVKIEGNKKLITQFLKAAEAGDYSQFVEVLDKAKAQQCEKYLLLVKDLSGDTALHLSISSKNIDHQIIEKLAKHRVLINWPGHRGITPLQLAATLGKKKSLTLLLSNGADINLQSDYGMTALARSAKSGHLEVVKDLITKGANLNITDRHNITPLQHAAKSGHLDVVMYIVELNVDIDTLDMFGMSALAWAVRNGHFKVVNYLINKTANINNTDRHGRSILHISIIASNWKVVELLVDNKAGLSPSDLKSGFLLKRAIDAKKLSVAKYLSDKGVTSKDLNQDDMQKLKEYKIKAS